MRIFSRKPDEFAEARNFANFRSALAEAQARAGEVSISEANQFPLSGCVKLVPIEAKQEFDTNIATKSEELAQVIPIDRDQAS